MKKKGFTLIETMIAITITIMIMAMIGPMVNAFIRVQDRLTNQSKVDGNLNEVIFFIKRDMKNAKNDGDVGNLGDKPAGVFDVNGNLLLEGDVGKKVIIFTDTEEIDDVTNELVRKHRYVKYEMVGDELKVGVSSDFANFSNSTTILDNIEDVEFKYKDRILMFYFKLAIPDRLDGKINSEVRDIGITKINFQ